MREKNFHYHFYARPFASNERTGKELLKSYLHNLEAMVRKYPYQWYNYYENWNDLPKKSKNGRKPT
jgi:predicted LPLAT superfamily acyltransferase